MKTDSFAIHSASSDRVLTFSGGSESWRVQLTGTGISAETAVWAGMGKGELNQFFQALGKMQRPWATAQPWEALESECALSAKCSALGEVTLDVTLRGNPGSAERWTLQAGLSLEFGQLVRMASGAQKFFGDSQ